MRVRFTVGIFDQSKTEVFDIEELVLNWAELDTSQQIEALQKAWQGWALQSVHGGGEVILQGFNLKAMR